MNRRSFLKSLVLLLAAFIPQKGNEEMNIGDVLKKLGRSSLTNAEQEALRLWGNETQMNNSYMGSLLRGNAYIPYGRMGDLQFDVVPLQMLSINQSTGQTASSGVDLAVIAEHTSSENIASTAFRVATGDTKVYVVDPNRRIGILGTVEWAAHATGSRWCYVCRYDVADNELSRQNLSVEAAGTNEIRAFSISGFLANYSATPTSYLKFWVAQNSGGNLVMTEFNACLFLVY